MHVSYRVTRQDDFVRFAVAIPSGCRALGWTAWAGRRAVGLGGVVIGTDGRVWGHFAATEDYRGAVLRGLHRRTIRLLRRIDALGISHIRAVCDVGIPRASEWMARLGFRVTDETVDGAAVHIRERGIWRS